MARAGIITRSLLQELRGERVQRLLGLALIALAACSLYWPFLENPLVFDDVNIFHTSTLTTAAIAPWELGIRGLPYFTLGWVETQIGNLTAHRLVSLALHVAVAYQLFRFLEVMLAASAGPQLPGTSAAPEHARWLALMVALAFACHPVAVYGAGYLVQRTIVFSTLFTLLCLRSLLQALQQNDAAPATWAALWASLAIMSKEHAVVVPIAALALVTVGNRPWPEERLRICAIFFVLSLPAMLFAAHFGLYALGRVYEPGIKEIESELYALPPFHNPQDKWLLSASSQAQLYFSYWRQWLLPDSGGMSVDLRVDFLRPWTHAGAWLWIACWAALAVAAGAALMRLKTGWLKTMALGVFLSAVLFAPELASVRFQEPYVLYRSYLWSIGYCTLAAALFMLLPRKLGLGLLAVAIPLLLFQATGRLETFRSRLVLWEDAASKLQKLEIGGSSRILFNRGGARFRAGNIQGALDDINQAIRLNPGNGRYRIARASALLRQDRAKEALEDLETAKVLLPQDGHLLFVQYLALKSLRRDQEADAALADAARYGNFAARAEMSRRRSPDGSASVEQK